MPAALGLPALTARLALLLCACVALGPLLSAHPARAHAQLLCEDGRALLFQSSSDASSASPLSLCCPASSLLLTRWSNGSALCVQQGACVQVDSQLCGDALECCSNGWDCDRDSSLSDYTAADGRLCLLASYDLRADRGAYAVARAAAPTQPRNVSTQCDASHSPCLHAAVCSQSYEGARCTCAGDPHAFLLPHCAFSCPAGLACEQPALHSANYSSSPCPRGYICPAGELDPLPCGAYHICPDEGMSTPLRCNDTQICRDTNATQPSLDCAAGSFCPTATNVTLCPVGHYCPLGSALPTPCTVGWSCVAEGLAAPQPCPSGRYCAGLDVDPSVPLWWCPDGRVLRNGSDWSASRRPTCCPINTASSGGVCVALSCITRPQQYGGQQGTFPTGSWYYCSGPYLPFACCPTGWSCWPRTDYNPPQFWCQRSGQWSYAMGYTPPWDPAATALAFDLAPQCSARNNPCLHSTQCTPQGIGVPSCSCPAFGFVGPVCAFECPLGTLCLAAPAANSTVFSSTTCPAGYYCAPSPLIPSPPPRLCPRSAFCPLASAAPTPCPRGSVCPDDGLSAPQLCDAGVACPYVNATTSEGACQPGWFCAMGAAPQLCDVGTYSSEPGMAACLSCPIGRLCPAGTRTPVVPVWACPIGRNMTSAQPADFNSTQFPLCCPPGEIVRGRACGTVRCGTSSSSTNIRVCGTTEGSGCCSRSDSFYGGVSCRPDGLTGCLIYYYSTGGAPSTRGWFDDWFIWRTTDPDTWIEATDVHAHCDTHRCTHGAACLPSFDGYTCSACPADPAFSHPSATSPAPPAAAASLRPRPTPAATCGSPAPPRTSVQTPRPCPRRLSPARLDTTARRAAHSPRAAHRARGVLRSRLRLSPAHQAATAPLRASRLRSAQGSAPRAARAVRAQQRRRCAARAACARRAPPPPSWCSVRSAAIAPTAACWIRPPVRQAHTAPLPDSARRSCAKLDSHAREATRSRWRALCSARTAAAAL